MNKKPVRLTMVKGAAVLAKLAEVCRTENIGDTKTAIYSDGWSDAKVAESMAFEVRTSSVGYLRHDIYGELPTHRGSSKRRTAHLESRVASLEAGLLALETLVLALKANAGPAHEQIPPALGEDSFL